MRGPEADAHVDPGLRREDGGGEGGGGEGGDRRAGGLRGGARGEGLLWRGERWAGGRGAGRVRRVAARDGGHVLRGGDRPGQDAAGGGMGGAVRRAGRREGDVAGLGAAGRVQPDEAGSPGPAAPVKTEFHLQGEASSCSWTQELRRKSCIEFWA